MKEKKGLYLVLFIVFSLFSLNFFKSERLKYMAMEIGILTKAEVYNRPDCGRSSNTMEVLIERKIFTLDIGKNDCIKGGYSIGQIVDVKYCAECGVAILPDYNANFGYWLSIIFFALPIYLLILLLSSSKNQAEFDSTQGNANIN